MTRLRAALLASALGVIAMPCRAAETSPCADDKRIECIVYRPNDVVHLFAAPGATLRIQLGDGEKVQGLHVSDERTLLHEEMEQQSGRDAMAEGQTSGGAHTCDPNLCRSVVANFVYLMPRRELMSQPFFLQTEWCDGAGKCQPVPYAFEIEAKAGERSQVASNSGDVPARPAEYYGVRFLYPERDAAERKRALAVKVAAWQAAHPSIPRSARAVPPPNCLAPAAPAANRRYVWQGAPELKPDRTCDDGRSTFMRFNGMRRVPNVYTYLPDGTETNGFGYTAEPDAAGTTLRIARTATRWCLRDGDRAACIINAGSDPEGRSASTVAPASAVAPMVRAP